MTLTRANVAEVKSRLSYFLRLAKSGEKVVICERNHPVAEIVPIPPPVDLALRESAFGLFAGGMEVEELRKALAPLTAE